MRRPVQVLVVAVVLGGLAGCDTSAPTGPGDPGGPVIMDTAEAGQTSGTGDGNGDNNGTGNGGGGLKGIPIDLGAQLFGEGIPVESVESTMRERIATGCAAAGLATDCVQVTRQIKNSAPTPSCFSEPDDPKTGAFLAYVGMSADLPSAGDTHKATLNSGETLVIYAKMCEPDEVVATDTPPTTTTTTNIGPSTPLRSTTTTGAVAPTTTTDG
ncbi:hypothetical protein ACFVMC_22480 [Nocardia sp. NPDC127579]|uniref:hypothetical protein n=1 Tax=Nocardia sp. NPDC127579 TaxID=3345402 RepID=UPI00363B5398